MWKWILGAVVVVILLIGSGMWYGVRKMTQLANGDSTVTMVIAGRPDRVYAALATGDSLGEWMVSGRVQASRRGLLRAGDTLRVEQRDSTMPSSRMRWIVTEASPGKAFAMELRADTLEMMAVSRRFVVMAQGDSTAVFSTVSSPIVDSVAKAASREGGGPMMSMVSKMMLGMMRMQNGLELKQLKGHIEGTEQPMRVRSEVKVQP